MSRPLSRPRESFASRKDDFDRDRNVSSPALHPQGHSHRPDKVAVSGLQGEIAHQLIDRNVLTLAAEDGDGFWPRYVDGYLGSVGLLESTELFVVVVQVQDLEIHVDPLG